LCLTNIKHPLFPDRIVIKIGYTADISNRLTGLLQEYKCDFMHLCGIVSIPNEQFEKDFHRLLESRFPRAICDSIRIKNVDKDELYLGDTEVVNEFFGLVNSAATGTAPPLLLSDRESLATSLELSREETARKQMELDMEREHTKRMEIQLEMLKLRLQHHPHP